MKNGLTYFLMLSTSFLLISIWGFATLNNIFATPLSTCIIIIATFVLTFPIKKIKLKYAKLVFMSGPAFYVLLSCIVTLLNDFTAVEIIFSPILAFYNHRFCFMAKQIEPKKYGFLVGFALLYCFYFYPKTGSGKSAEYPKIVLKEEEQCQPNYNYNLVVSQVGSVG